MLGTGLTVRGKELFISDVTVDELTSVKTVLTRLFNSQASLLNQAEEEVAEHQVQKDQYRVSQFMLSVLPVCIQNSSETVESENKAIDRALRISKIAAQRLSTYRKDK